MKSLNEGNVFSRYYWEKTNPKEYNFQSNQNASLTSVEQTNTRKSNRLGNSKSSNTSGITRSRSRDFSNKNGKKLIKKSPVSNEMEKENNVNVENAMMHFFNKTHSSVDSVPDFSYLFRFYPSLTPCDNYRELNKRICKTFTNYLKLTLAKIITFTKNQEIFKVRELLRFNKDLENKVNILHENLINFFQNNPFSCQNGIRFTSLKSLFDHKSCMNCKEQDKPNHICQCMLIFDNHEDWVNHTFSRKSAGCPLVLFTLFLMHDRYVKPNPADNVCSFFCHGCYRKTTNFIDLYFHMTYCPGFELKLTKNCQSCSKKSRQDYETTNCHRLRNCKSTFSLPNQPSPTNYIKLLSKYFKVPLPNLLLKSRK